MEAVDDIKAAAEQANAVKVEVGLLAKALGKAVTDLRSYRAQVVKDGNKKQEQALKQLEEARKKAEDKAKKAMESAIVVMKKAKIFTVDLSDIEALIETFRDEDGFDINAVDVTQPFLIAGSACLKALFAAPELEKTLGSFREHYSGQPSMKT